MAQALSMQQLAQRVAEHSATLERKLRENGIESSPSISDINPTDLDKIDKDAARELASACRELQTLAQGPFRSMQLYSYAGHESSSVGTLAWFDIAAKVPLEGSISFEDVAKEAKIDKDKLTRIIRYAATNLIFREYPPGHVSHTSGSAYLHKNPSFNALCKAMIVDLGPSFLNLPHALQKWPHSESPFETCAALAYGLKAPKDDFFAWLDQDQKRSARFNEGMIGFSQANRPLSVDVEAFPWGDLPEGATIVDVGGGFGHVSKAVAEKYPKLKFIIQDLPQAVADAKDATKHEWEQGRLKNVTFEEHDFFNKQPDHKAAVYFLRHIVHGLSDTRVKQVLQNIAPVLQPGARILFSEYVIPPVGSEKRDLVGERLLRGGDLTMMSVHNAKERSEEDFRGLLRQAIPQITSVKLHQPQWYTIGGIVEGVYKGDK